MTQGPSLRTMVSILAPLSSKLDRLEVALAKLRELAEGCAGCNGTRRVRIPYELRFMTDDPRNDSNLQRMRKNGNPRASNVVASMLRVGHPCAQCDHIWQIVENKGAWA